VIAREHGWISSAVVECNEDDDLPLLMARLCHRALRRLSTSKRVGTRVKRALGVLRAFTFAMDDQGAWRFNIDVKAVTRDRRLGRSRSRRRRAASRGWCCGCPTRFRRCFFLDELQFLGKRSLA
jgi:hypothetical protein